MTTHDIITVICAIFGSGALFGFVQFVINRHDEKKGVIAEIASDVKELKINDTRRTKDVLKMQIMVLIANYPRKVTEILDATKHYFVDLDGDTYITALFADWLVAGNIDRPDWFVEYMKKDIIR